jgi:hypothetical protein
MNKETCVAFKLPGHVIMLSCYHMEPCVSPLVSVTSRPKRPPGLYCPLDSDKDLLH